MTYKKEQNTIEKAETSVKQDKKLQQLKIIKNTIISETANGNSKYDKLPKMPYADYDAIKSHSILNVRFLLATGNIPSKLEEEYCTIPDDYIAPLTWAIWRAAKYVTVQMKRKGIDRSKATELSGINTSLFSKYEKYDRPFTPAPSKLSCFCRNVLHESCHKVMFGEEGRIILPYLYSMVFAKAMRLPETSINKLLAFARQLKAIYELEHPTKIPNGAHIAPPVMVKERMEDLATDIGRPCMFLFKNEETKLPMNKRLYALLFAVFSNDEEKKQKEFSVPTLMYFALETGYALDYFVSEDFSTSCPIYIHDNDELVLIDDLKILELIGITYMLNKEKRIQLLSEILSTCILNENQTIE